MSLMDRLKKTSKIDLSSVMDESEIFENQQVCPTEVPIVNVALSGSLKGGLQGGITEIAGPSKHFKSFLALLLIRSFFNKHSDGVCLFYDAEFGAPKPYFTTFGIDMKRVLHSPITDVEQLKHDIMTQLKDLKRDEPVIILLDSIGQLASKKEVDDTLEGKNVADMSRAKAIKSLFRMITPHLKMKDIPMIVVNHTYKEIGMYPKDIVGGGTGPTFASDTIWIVGRQQEKVESETTGFHFILNAEKSRYVKEKSKFPVTVMFDKGIERYSGLLENAIEAGFVEKPSPGWYCKVDQKTKERGGKVRESETKNDEFWGDILINEVFDEFLRKKFAVAYGEILERKPQPQPPKTTSKGK